MSAVGRFAAGDRMLLVDSRRRRHLVELVAGGEFHTHNGAIAHDDIIGASEGDRFRTANGARYCALRPTLADHVLKMPRGAQVIYPKDLGAIVMLADVAAGMHVFETGVGSGAMSAALLRTGAHVTGYELRPDFARIAHDNVETFCGRAALERYTVLQRDSYASVDLPYAGRCTPPAPCDADLPPAPDGGDDAKPDRAVRASVSADDEHGGVQAVVASDRAAGFDRAVLDVPEPWRVVPHLERALRSGGILAAYSPSIIQVQQLRRVLDRSQWVMVETLEVLHRTWHVQDASVRPDHRMIGHTGFVTHARLLADS